MVSVMATKTMTPPERLTISEAAEKYRYVKVQGAYQGWWQNNTTPYMVEPANTLNSRAFSAVIFASSAQSGKTDSLIVNWVLFGTVVDPMDHIIYSPTHAAAKDFSIRRIDRLGRDSPAVADAKLKERDADNKFEKLYSNGMLLTLSWPSVTELAGRPVGRVAITDYDRIDDDIDGEGSAFDLAIKRTTTYGSFAMCMAESSPSRPVKDGKAITTGHMAPPCDGILSLYNRGNRKMWYWPCPFCGGYFSPSFDLIQYSDYGGNLTRSESATMVCPLPGCGEHIRPDQRYEMNVWGRWLADGQTLDAEGFVVGEAVRSAIASYWLDGTAAAFITWPKLVNNYLDAMDSFESTGNEDALKKFYNTDLGRPYMPKSMETERRPEELAARAEPLGDRVVPVGVRLLVATVDVQKSAFVVQVHGVSPGRPFDLTVIDRFDILKSKRLDDDGEHRFVKPATYAEDWDQLISEVIYKTYPLDDDSGRSMAVKITVCDAGGSANNARATRGGVSGSGGVTANAYAFVRTLRAQGLANRFHLVRGVGTPTAPDWKISYPDSSDRSKKAIAKGDVPVLMLNSNKIKDQLSNLLSVMEPGKGLVRFPDWLEPWWFGEVCAEVRTDQGWKNPKKRNEAWDLLYYCLGVLKSSLLPVEKLAWDNPPLWAGPWDSNPFVVTPERPTPFQGKRVEPRDFSALAKELA